MSIYDHLQMDLVVRCEKPHEFGLRHRGISGDICNKLLRDFLGQEFPRLSFDTGVTTPREKKGDWFPAASEELSPHCDIICYIGPPFEQIYDYIVVPLKFVLFTIEVKKWVWPLDLRDPERGYNKQVQGVRQFTGKPIGLVCYRHEGKYQDLMKNSVADATFLFSTQSRDYPDYAPDFFDNCLHKGELERLVNWVRSFV